MNPDERLQRLLGGDHLAGLRKRLRRRFEQAAPDLVFRIGQLTPQEHAALAALTGQKPRFAGSLRIDIGALDDALRQAGIAASLRDALEHLDGPIVDLAAQRDHTQRQWTRVADSVAHAGLRRFLESPAAMGLLRRLSDGDPSDAAGLCSGVEAVLRWLPAEGLTRAQLAADVLGDAHALDNGRAAATLVLAVLRDAAADADLTMETTRVVWASAGVLVNELARPALFLNLPVAEGQGWARGEPGFVSLRALVRSPPAWDVAGRDIYVCENPNLLAIAADRMGPLCPPMVCTDGMPAAAQGRLLNQLRHAGGLLLYHGDFDWSGLRIGNHVMQAYGARPWRFGATDYRTAVAGMRQPGQRLNGDAVIASWDADLTAVMGQHQVAIAEEGVASSLLRGLAE